MPADTVGRHGEREAIEEYTAIMSHMGVVVAPIKRSMFGGTWPSIIEQSLA